MAVRTVGVVASLRKLFLNPWLRIDVNMANGFHVLQKGREKTKVRCGGLAWGREGFQSRANRL